MAPALPILPAGGVLGFPPDDARGHWQRAQ
jgi:hypothetical protein